MKRAEIKEAIEKGNLGDFVCNQQHRITKDELVELVKQLDYTIWQQLDEFEYKFFNTQLIENLDYYDFFDEEEKD